VLKVRERLAVNKKKRSHRFHEEMFNLKKLDGAGGKQKYCAEASNRFAVLKALDAELNMNSDWENIRENIKI
jgi:hypothetical protein